MIHADPAIISIRLPFEGRHGITRMPINLLAKPIMYRLRLALAILVLPLSLFFITRSPARTDSLAFQNPDPATYVPASPIQPASSAIRTIIHPGDGAVMVYISPGPFRMGNNSGWPEEQPEHIVDLPGFYIDCYEVTIAMFRRFVESGASADPAYWREGEIRTQMMAGEYKRSDWSVYDGLPDDTAMFGVRFGEADAYCRWAGKHLPAAEQWEKAARGTDGRLYPWGNEWETGRCNCISIDAFAQGIDLTSEHPVSVTAFPEGDSPYGVRQMAGNVWEWCCAGMLPYPGNEHPYKFYSTFWGVFQPELRGGCWMLDPRFCTTTFRIFSDPGIREKAYGFRCCCEEDNIRE